MATLYAEYDRFAEFYDDFAIGYAEDLHVISEEVQQKNARRILELCSGTGRCSLDLALQGFEVVGIDLSMNMVNVANAKLAALQSTSARSLDVEFHVMNVEDFQLQGKFDMIFSTWSSLQHLDMEGRTRCYRQVFNHLKEGGIFFDDEAIRPASELQAASGKYQWYKQNAVFCREGKLIFQYYVDHYDHSSSIQERTLFQDKMTLFDDLCLPLQIPVQLQCPIERNTVRMLLHQPDLEQNEKALKLAGFKEVRCETRKSQGGTAKERFCIIAEK
jgi:SAM-dependent methyltransferase